MTSMVTDFEDRLLKLERQMSRLKDDRSVGAVFDGKFSLKWPARIQGPNGDAYIVVRKPGGILATVAADSYTSDDWTDGAAYELLPIGSIVAYNGSEDDIPEGWHLCDGDEGTDDLSGKFILGGDFTTAGTSADEQATVIAAHSNHVFTQPSAHSTPTMGGADTSQDIADSGSGMLAATSEHEHTIDPLSAHAGGAVDAHSAHSVSTDYFPPYWQYALIQRIA